MGLPLDEVTLAETLGARGYRSICIGKWHLGHTRKFLPREQGFDDYYGILYSNDMWPVQLVRNGEVVEYPVVQAQLTKKYTERAVRFIENNKERPFFLYLPHTMPHKPLAASERFYTPETPDDLYADVIRELDWSVGRILAKLERLGLTDETLVLFASDNGPWFGGDTGGLRGMKARTWEGGIRVPFIARWPGKIPDGQVCDAPVASADIFPTLCRITGTEVPADRTLDGKNIFPLMRDASRSSPHDAIFAMRGPTLRTVRSGKWKLHVRSPGKRPGFGSDWEDPRAPDGVTLIAPYEQPRPSEYPGTVGGDGPRAGMLFNLEKDPAETRDVSGTHPQVVKRLRKHVERAEASFGELHRGDADWSGLRRLTGGKLRYDRFIDPQGK